MPGSLVTFHLLLPQCGFLLPHLSDHSSFSSPVCHWLRPLALSIEAVSFFHSGVNKTEEKLLHF